MAKFGLQFRMLSYQYQILLVIWSPPVILMIYFFNSIENDIVVFFFK